MHNHDSHYTPQEAPCEVLTEKRRASIGLPKSTNKCERRFPLTPEAVEALVGMGFEIKIERGAAEHIHYSDNAYSKAGAALCSRDEALQCEIVINLAPLEICDIRKLRRGALLLSLANFNRKEAQQVVRELLNRRIINIAIDLVRDQQGHRPFGDILSEIEGRSVMTIAASMLADPINGKGILLGGIAGVIPCEVTIIGSCLAACAAARSAIGLGATVRMFDDDVYRLRSALRQIGNGVIGSSLHRHVLDNALHSADIVIITDANITLPEANPSNSLKRKCLIFDLSEKPGLAFPTARLHDLGDLTHTAAETSSSFSFFNDLTEQGLQHRICFLNPGGTVPRTAAMALSDTFITLLRQIAGCEDSGASLPMTPGLQEATLTFMDKVVNERVSELTGIRYTDIRLLLSLS